MRREQTEAVGAGLFLLGVVLFLAYGLYLDVTSVIGWLT